MRFSDLNAISQSNKINFLQDIYFYVTTISRRSNSDEKKKEEKILQINNERLHINIKKNSVRSAFFHFCNSYTKKNKYIKKKLKKASKK